MILTGQGSIQRDVQHKLCGRKKWSLSPFKALSALLAGSQCTYFAEGCSILT